jgi:hypothetical protein
MNKKEALQQTDKSVQEQRRGVVKSAEESKITAEWHNVRNVKHIT